jgi:polyhydroxyalkanoate synthesis regulator phasin
MKKMLQFLLVGILITLSVSVKAQETFSFRYNMEEQSEIQDINDLKEHFLGEDIAKKFLLLKESYTYMIEDELTQNRSTIVEKPSIYYSCKKVSKYMKKAIKKGNITEDEARAQLDNILNIALNIRYQETEKVEEILWEIKDPNQLMAFYKDKVKLEFGM